MRRNYFFAPLRDVFKIEFPPGRAVFCGLPFPCVFGIPLAFFLGFCENRGIGRLGRFFEREPKREGAES